MFKTFNTAVFVILIFWNIDDVSGNCLFENWEYTVYLLSSSDFPEHSWSVNKTEMNFFITDLAVICFWVNKWSVFISKKSLPIITASFQEVINI